MSILPMVRRNWFLFGICFVIIAAKLEPWIGCKGGPIRPEITVKYIAVSIIFFNSGLSLRTEDLAHAALQFRLHTFIQTFTLLLVPVLMSLIVSALSLGPMDPWLLKGLLVVSSMPPPVSSAVILTKAVGGNEAGAIFNSAFGSFLGIIITPMWLLYFLGSTAEVSLFSIFVQLSMTVVFPLIVGQIARFNFKYKLMRWDIPFGSISSAILLVIIYTTFCDTFKHEEIDIDEMSLASIVMLVILLQCGLLLLVFYLTTRAELGLQPEDVVCCLFCATHKSLTLGIPILGVLFSGHPQVSIISLPLLIYHPTQILLGGMLVPSVRAWMTTTHRLRYCEPEPKSYELSHSQHRHSWLTQQYLKRV